MRKSGNKVRITAQLIKAADGYHLWSETYDRTLDDIFAVQDDIAGEVVKALKLTLLGTAPTTRSRPLDSEAYNLALQGRFFLDRRGREDLERSVEYFRRSRERDPGYAPAWAGLSEAYARQADSGFVPAADGFRRAREAAEKALALDPSSLTRIWRWAGFIKSTTGTGRPRTPAFAEHWTWNPATPWPSGAPASRRLTLGRWNEAIDLANKAIERDPLRPNSYSNLGFALLAVNRDTEAEAAFRKALELDPDGAISASGARAGPAFAGQDRRRPAGDAAGNGGDLAALRIAARISRARPAQRVRRGAGGPEGQVRREMAYQIAEVHAFRGEADLAFEWLERAYDQRDGGVAEIKGDRLMRGLVGDPRYKAFLRKLKLPE